MKMNNAFLGVLFRQKLGYDSSNSKFKKSDQRKTKCKSCWMVSCMTGLSGVLGEPSISGDICLDPRMRIPVIVLIV